MQNFIYLFIFCYFSPSTLNNSSTASHKKSFLNRPKYYSEISDDDLRSGATNSSTSERFNDENSINEDLNN
jgi:hypothetical protein